jgi:hypothetical protein
LKKTEGHLIAQKIADKVTASKMESPEECSLAVGKAKRRKLEEPLTDEDQSPVRSLSPHAPKDLNKKQVIASDEEGVRSPD